MGEGDKMKEIIKERVIKEKWYEKICERCGELFTEKNRYKKNCDDCTKIIFEEDKNELRNKFLNAKIIDVSCNDHALYSITILNEKQEKIHIDTMEEYNELDFEVVTGTKSDAYERAWVRYQEMHQSISLIRQILKHIPDDDNYHQQLPNVLHWKIPAGQTYVKAESTRGEYGFFMVSDGSEYPRRVAVRGPSYTHAVALMEDLSITTNIADIPGLMVSLHTYPPEIER